MQNPVKDHPLHDSFPSVVNLNNPKQIEIFTNEFPELLDCYWAIEEKYHGFNFQVTYLPDTETDSYEPDYAGSREMQVTRDTKFYGAWAAIDHCQDVFVLLRSAAQLINKKITAYMEIFGGKVSKGIRYDVPVGTYKVRFIGLKLDDSFLCPNEFYNFTKIAGIPDSMVSLPIAIVKGIQAAVDFDPVFHAMDAIAGDGSDKDRSFAEGIVAKPLHQHYVNKGGKNILIKKKSARFEEFASEKTVREVNPEAESLREIFKGFLNENRINSALSKLGPIVSKQQIAGYLKHIMSDAFRDFEEQYGEMYYALSGDDQKSVLNVGGFVANQLLEQIRAVA